MAIPTDQYRSGPSGLLTKKAVEKNNTDVNASKGRTNFCQFFYFKMPKLL